MYYIKELKVRTRQHSYGRTLALDIGRVAGDRGGNSRDMRDRLGTKPKDALARDNCECHICKQVGHIARNWTTPRAALPSKPPASRLDAMAAHKTTGHVCESCGKPGHTSAQCWSAHPELVPEALLKKRQSAVTATARKRRKAAEYVSPNYHFQGMALTYRRPLSPLQNPSFTLPTWLAQQSWCPLPILSFWRSRLPKRKILH